MANPNLAELGKKTQFQKGNTLRPAKPNKKDRSIRYYWIAMTKCSFAQWDDIIGRAVIDALDGDRHARKFLADYLMGPPVKRSEITGKDGGPIELANANLTEEQRTDRFDALMKAAMERQQAQDGA